MVSSRVPLMLFMSVYFLLSLFVYVYTYVHSCNDDDVLSVVRLSVCVASIILRHRSFGVHPNDDNNYYVFRTVKYAAYGVVNYLYVLIRTLI